MTEQSKTLEIMRRIGAPEPEKIRITGIIQSPVLASITLVLPGGDDDSSAELLSIFGSHEINIRFISKYSDRSDHTSICLCIEAELLDTAVDLISTNEKSLGVKEFIFRPQVQVISIYPHKERARVAERLLTTLRMNGIEPLSANNASSVMSCVLSSEYVEKALACLNQAFELP
jgi:aspartokinase